MADGLEADVEELFALLRSHGALKRAYVPLRQALPDALRKTSDAHGLVLACLVGSNWWERAPHLVCGK